MINTYILRVESAELFAEDTGNERNWLLQKVDGKEKRPSEGGGSFFNGSNYGTLRITHAWCSFQGMHMHGTITNALDKKEITQLDSPICEANDGELCDQFKCCGEVLDSYT